MYTNWRNFQSSDLNFTGMKIESCLTQIKEKYSNLIENITYEGYIDSDADINKKSIWLRSGQGAKIKIKLKDEWLDYSILKLWKSYDGLTKTPAYFNKEDGFFIILPSGGSQGSSNNLFYFDDIGIAIILDDNLCYQWKEKHNLGDTYYWEVNQNVVQEEHKRDLNTFKDFLNIDDVKTNNWLTKTMEVSSYPRFKINNVPLKVLNWQKEFFYKIFNLDSSEQQQTFFQKNGVRYPYWYLPPNLFRDLLSEENFLWSCTNWTFEKTESSVEATLKDENNILNFEINEFDMMGLCEIPKGEWRCTQGFSVIEEEKFWGGHKYASEDKENAKYGIAYFGSDGYPEVAVVQGWKGNSRIDTTFEASLTFDENLWHVYPIFSNFQINKSCNYSLLCLQESEQWKILKQNLLLKTKKTQEINFHVPCYSSYSSSFLIGPTNIGTQTEGLNFKLNLTYENLPDIITVEKIFPVNNNENRQAVLWNADAFKILKDYNGQNHFWTQNWIQEAENPPGIYSYFKVYIAPQFNSNFNLFPKNLPLTTCSGNSKTIRGIKRADYNYSYTQKEYQGYAPFKWDAENSEWRWVGYSSAENGEPFNLIIEAKPETGGWRDEYNYFNFLLKNENSEQQCYRQPILFRGWLNYFNRESERIKITPFIDIYNTVYIYTYTNITIPSDETNTSYFLTYKTNGTLKGIQKPEENQHQFVIEYANDLPEADRFFELYLDKYTDKNID